MSEHEILLQALAQEFGASTFMARDVLERLPFHKLPERARFSTIASEMLGAQQLRSLGLTFREMAGIEAVKRTKAGVIWRLNPAAPAVKLGAAGGDCPHCLKPFGNLAAHEVACARRAVPAPPAPNTYVEEVRHEAERVASVTHLPSEAERILIERAGTVAMPDEAMRPAQRLLSGVSELDAARVMRAIESGVRMEYMGRGRWAAPRGHGLSVTRTGTIVSEMIRTGLLRHFREHRVDHLVPAPVHWLCEGQRPLCDVPGWDRGPMRVRLHADPKIVDCRKCLP